MKYLLDANVLVHVANDVPEAARITARLERIPKGSFGLSAITAHELRFMIVRAKASRKHVAALQSFMHGVPVIDFDLPAAHAAADVRAELAAIGQPLGPYDVLLAGHARRRGCVVVTDNVREFGRVRHLVVENWLR